MKIFLDTSAYVKIFKRECGSSLIKKIIKLAQANKIQLYFSIWVLNESTAAIDKGCHQKNKINVQRKNIIATILQETLIYSKFQNIIFVTLDFNIVKGSHKLIIEHHISADDALHFFTAYSEQCDHFICSDKHLTNRPKVRWEH